MVDIFIEPFLNYTTEDVESKLGAIDSKWIVNLKEGSHQYSSVLSDSGEREETIKGAEISIRMLWIR